MRWIRSLAAGTAAAALFSAPAFASNRTSATNAISEKKLIQDSGYSGWQRKWANVNQIGDRNVCSGLNFYSMQRQIAMGKQVAERVIRMSKLIKDPVVTDYVNKVGQRLVRNSDATVPYSFHVIDSDVLNAFSLPGGFVFVNSGVILHADNEAELAGVMGHEIAHVAACHGAKQATKGDIAQIASIPLSMVIPYTWAGYAMYEGIDAAVPLAFLKFSREDEAQADYLGLEYMYKAGYDPNAFVDFFEKVTAQEQKQPSSIPTIFSDHPATASRIAAVQKEIATILPPRPEYLVDTSTFERVKKRLEEDVSREKIQIQQDRAPTLRRKKPNGSKPPVLKRRPGDY